MCGPSFLAVAAPRTDPLPWCCPLLAARATHCARDDDSRRRDLPAPGVDGPRHRGLLPLPKESEIILSPNTRCVVTHGLHKDADGYSCVELAEVHGTLHAS